MPSAVVLTDKQHVAAGVSILDQDGQPFASIPEGVTVSFSSLDPSVADFVVGPDGLNGDVTSGVVGQTVITAVITLPDASVISDTLSVAVQNSLPGSANFTVGSPQEEA